MMTKGHDDESAKKICGAMQAQMGGSDNNFVSYELDNKGSLYLKYFLADSTYAKNTAVGDFSLNGAAITNTASQAVGLPFSILPSRDLSLFGDFHPWSPNDNASYDEHVNFARQYSPGHIVAVTPHSQLGAAQDVVNNNGMFAVVEITDPKAKDAYTKNPALIPRAVSPGIMNMEAPNKDNISSFRWAHLAAVPMGAYGDKAKLYASCMGNKKDCVNKLIAAGVADKASKTNYCAIGASENLLNTSLNFQHAPFNNMSSQTDSTNTVTAQAPVSTTPSVAVAPVTTTPEKKTGVLRLKTQSPVKPNQDPNQPQAVQAPVAEQKPADLSKFEEMEKKLAEIEAREQLNARLGTIKNLIDMRLFTVNGKYNQKEHEAAIQEAAQSNWTDEQISKYYGGLLRIKEFEDTQNANNKNRGLNSYNPLGGSVYVTPSSVPELMGASGDKDMDLDTFRIMKVKALMETFGIGERL